MELHHRLRRDPNWHKDACNICGQLGHQAANCTSGTVNWRQIYGDNAFILRPPVYWSEELAFKKTRQADVTDLEKRAREYAKAQAAQQGLDFEEILRKGKELQEQDPSVTIPKVVKAEEIQQWATQHDRSTAVGWDSCIVDGKEHFLQYTDIKDLVMQLKSCPDHKKTMKTQWDKPTEETPVS